MTGDTLPVCPISFGLAAIDLITAYIKLAARGVSPRQFHEETETGSAWRSRTFHVTAWNHLGDRLLLPELGGAAPMTESRPPPSTAAKSTTSARLPPIHHFKQKLKFSIRTGSHLAHNHFEPHHTSDSTRNPPYHG